MKEEEGVWIELCRFSFFYNIYFAHLHNIFGCTFRDDPIHYVNGIYLSSLMGGSRRRG